MATAVVDLRPGEVEVRHRRGDVVAFSLILNEDGDVADITGRTYRAQIRRKPAAAVSATPDVTVTDGPGGTLTVVLDEDASRALSGRYAWDLEQTVGGQRRTILAGTWAVDDDVTRDDP